jgi:hypothetical protein
MRVPLEESGAAVAGAVVESGRKSGTREGYLMNANARLGMTAFVGFVMVALLGGPAMADPDQPATGDVNAVFAPMRELPRDVLDRANGKGISDLEQTATLTVNGTNPQEDSAALQSLQTLPSGSFTGDNSIAASAFSGSQVFAAIVQNNGSYVNIQNLLAVEVNMHQ